MIQEECNLKIDWCTHSAAKYACEHWHYSGCMPSGKIVKLGIWESGKYIGCILFSSGATFNIGSPYGLGQDGVCELTRVAINNHNHTVSKYISLAIKKLKEKVPGIRLVVSYADTGQGHTGGIYQAGNWIYEGLFEGERYISINGKVIHRRSIGAKYGTSSIPKLESMGLKVKSVVAPGKYKYLYPLDKKMRRQIIKLSKPYPKKPADEVLQVAQPEILLGGDSSSLSIGSTTQNNKPGGLNGKEQTR